MSNQALIPPGNPAPNQNHPALALEAALDALLGDRDFLSLQHREDRPNLFRILGTSFTEMWHSAFLKWLLDPSSHHGLGDFPLKRFLATVLTLGIRSDENGPFAPKATLADIEQADLRQMQFKTEHPTGRPRKGGGSARVDVYGWTPDLGSVDDWAKARPGVLKPLQVVIENKIRAREQAEQTKAYFEWADQLDSNTSFYVFLTLEDARAPEHPAFIQLYYQGLFDRVLLPVLSHPNLTAEARFLVEQYMANLTDTTHERPMAQGDKDLCARLYERHQQVFDTVFLAVKGDLPAPKSGRISQRYTVTLRDLVDARLIEVGQKLVGRNKADAWEAELIEEGGSFLLQSVLDSAKKSSSPSRTASDLVGRPMNGWAFWEVKGGPANGRSLADLREKLLSQGIDDGELV